jgi:hypothetical protein
MRKLCRDDPEARDLIDRETANPHGGDRKSEQIKMLIQPLDNDSKSEQSDRNLRRLRKDAPDLHQQVLSGAKSVTRAAIEAGIYPRRARSIPVGRRGDVHRREAAVRRHLQDRPRPEAAAFRSWSDRAGRSEQRRDPGKATVSLDVQADRLHVIG